MPCRRAAVLIDLLTTLSAEATNSGVLKALDDAELDACPRPPGVRQDPTGGRDKVASHCLAALSRALGHERRLIAELRRALGGQRRGIAGGDPDVIQVGERAISRILLTLGEARRGRAQLARTAADISADCEVTLWQRYAVALDALRRAGQSAAGEVRRNQELLRLADEAGEAFVQDLFARTAGSLPCLGDGGATRRV